MREAAITIRRGFPRLDRRVRETFSGLPTGFVTDARGHTGALESRIRPVAGPPSFAGSALTVHAGPRDNLAAWAAMDLCEEGDVLVIATDGSSDCSVIGDIYAGVARNRGAAAIVTDGHVRDATELEEVGLPVFACGLSPNGPGKRGPGEVGLPIVLAGARIESGDLVLGDRDGVVHVPRGEVDDVIAALDGVRAREEEMDRAVREGLRSAPWLPEVLGKLGLREVDG